MSSKRVFRVQAVKQSCVFGEAIELHVVAEEKKSGQQEPEVFYVGDEGWELARFGGQSDPIRITPEIAQELTDSLWAIGIRPYAAKGSAGQLSAVENHLSDMRRIAFKGLEMEAGK